MEISLKNLSKKKHLLLCFSVSRNDIRALRGDPIIICLKLQISNNHLRWNLRQSAATIKRCPSRARKHRWKSWQRRNCFCKDKWPRVSGWVQSCKCSSYCLLSIWIPNSISRYLIKCSNKWNANRNTCSDGGKIVCNILISIYP